MFLNVLPVPSGPPFVNVEASHEFVRGGATINITCTVMGEPDVDVSFSWSYPGQVNIHNQTLKCIMMGGGGPGGAPGRARTI